MLGVQEVGPCNAILPVGNFISSRISLSLGRWRLLPSFGTDGTDGLGWLAGGRAKEQQAGISTQLSPSSYTPLVEGERNLFLGATTSLVWMAETQPCDRGWWCKSRGACMCAYVYANGKYGRREEIGFFPLAWWWFKVLTGFRGGGCCCFLCRTHGGEWSAAGGLCMGFMVSWEFGAVVVVGGVWENVKTQREPKDVGYLGRVGGYLNCGSHSPGLEKMKKKRILRQW